MSSTATLNDLDDPLESAPLQGNINSGGTKANLNNAIGGEDRRAPINTIDETVWTTLSRDITASWRKMKLVLWPNHLFGGLLQRENHIERGESGAGGGLADRLQGIAGRLQDADTILTGQISDELRDWDLWYVFRVNFGCAC